MIFKNLKLQKIISGFIIIAILAPSILIATTPKKAEAQWVVTDPAQVVQTGVSLGQVLKEVLRQFLMLAAKRLLARMTQNTINWINAGFHGNPLYIENPRSFFNDIAKTEIRYMANLFGFDRTRYPYGRAFAQNIIRSYQSQLATNAEYSLSRALTDPTLLESYRRDFSTGGWSGFLVNTQHPQNNYIGFNMMATQELARRLDGTIQTPIQNVQTALQQGQGFLSPKTCPTNPHYNNFRNEFQRPTFQPTTPYNPPEAPIVFGSTAADDVIATNRRLVYEEEYNRAVQNEYGVWQMTNDCPGGLVATTPGSVVASHIMKAVNIKFDQNTLAGALGNDLASSFAAILDALMSKFLNEGLSRLSNAINPEDIEECNFEYFGDRTEQCGGLADGGTGACIAYINENGSAGLRDDVIAAIDRALDQDPELAAESATRENAQRMRDLIVGELQSAGFEASASYNGNCNLSPNNLGVRASGGAFGEIYDVTRDDPSMTVEEASTTVGRPIFNGTAEWGFITGGKDEAGSSQPDPSTIQN